MQLPDCEDSPVRLQDSSTEEEIMKHPNSSFSLLIVRGCPMENIRLYPQSVPCSIFPYLSGLVPTVPCKVLFALAAISSIFSLFIIDFFWFTCLALSFLSWICVLNIVAYFDCSLFVWPWTLLDGLRMCIFTFLLHNKSLHM